ncbi:unnamed protein product [Paramecium sonneborni]|uniref:Uncharacterized protein n=1 Tax=Paramecium sonneborni TaxID=65129 RepID=A0A8S1RSL2_9CILI|nr:unnamed protein product [Paramecium sonneborni]
MEFACITYEMVSKLQFQRSLLQQILQLLSIEATVSNFCQPRIIRNGKFCNN